MLMIVTFSVFYPVIYATEENNISTNEITEVQEEEKAQNLVTEEVTEESEEEPEEATEEIKLEEVTETRQEETILEEPKTEPEQVEQPEQSEPKEVEIIPNEEPQNVEAPLNYAGRMYLDSPANNQTTMASANTLKIQGWAVSSDSGAALHLYVNGRYISNIHTRTSRGDVDNSVSPAYGGTAATPKAGFEFDLDIGAYTQGTYEIVVYQVARNETIISKDTRTIQIKSAQYTGRMYLDSPTNGQTIVAAHTKTLKIQGWAVSSDSGAALHLYVNGRYISNIHTRTSRGDVDSSVSPAYGGTATTPKAGFEFNLDIESYPQGTYEIVVYQVARNGTIISKDTRTIQIEPVQYAGRMYLDSPINGQTIMGAHTKKVKIQGWAVSSDNQAALHLYVNGRYISNIHTRTARGDVDASISPVYGGTATTPKAGFEFDLDIESYPQGTYEIVVYQVARNGTIISKDVRTIQIEPVQYAGKMYLDSPTNGQTIMTAHTQNLKIQGWAVSADSQSSIRLYVNGNYISNIHTRTGRGDVDNSISPAYGGTATTPKAGFEFDLNIGNYAQGTYEIVVYQVARNETIISKDCRTVYLATARWGIDVSHHQGAINWNAVKNSGVNFAILKIGEYRESSGRILKDEHFEEYYRECKRLGIAVGGYFYSYAFNPTEAAHEADACSQLISGKSFEMPIFFDIEDKIVTNAINTGRTNRNEVTNAAITFCDVLNQRGYQAGVYSYRNFFYSYLNMAQLEKYNIWLAHYVANTDYTGKYDMWQYTSSGTIPGITGAVDLNWCFKRYY